ncbi:hypothetical protein D3C87_1718760 [compost metagenome]
MHESHPLHEFNRKVAVLVDQDFQVLLLDDADDTVLDGFAVIAVMHISVAAEFAKKISFLKDVKDQFLAVFSGFGNFHLALSDIKQLLRLVAFPKDVGAFGRILGIHNIFQPGHILRGEKMPDLIAAWGEFRTGIQ